MKSDKVNRFQISIEVNAKPPDIWDTLVQFSNYRSWNPVVNHAAIYGPVSEGTEIKILSGKWDLNFVIVNTFPPKRFEIDGSSIGLNMKILLDISSHEDGSMISIDTQWSGWLTKIFTKKFKEGIEDNIDMFLSALQRRVSRGESYSIERDDDSVEEEDERKGFSLPTPFNLIYKSRKRKSPKRRSFLK
jgi:hypothetical protein